jgi:DNA-binding XRE family transcriptional regulator
MLSLMTKTQTQKNANPLQNIIKTTRISLGLTQEALAIQAGVCLGCVAVAERNGKIPSSLEGLRIAKVLGLPEPIRSARKRGPMAV